MFWTVFFGLFGVASFIAFLIVSWKQTRRKRLAYQIIYYDRLLTAGDELKDHVQILFDDTPVPDISTLLMRIWNVGNEPIRKEDYEAPISLSFDTARILGYELIGTVPASLKAAPKVASPHRLEFPNMLLYSGYRVSFKLLLTGPLEDPVVDAQIVGMNRIERREYRFEPPYMRWLFVGMYAFCFLAMIALAVSIPFFGPHASANVDAFFGITFFSLIVLMLLCAIVLATARAVRRYRKRH